MEKKKKKLLELLKSYGKVVVALSGGVDSMTLAKAAVLALGEGAVAVTATSELLARQEEKDAAAGAKAIGIRQVVLPAEDLSHPEVVRNDKERCYYCKRYRFQKLKDWAESQDIAYVADGSNVDDAGDYRPGMRAVKELGIVSPLAQCGFTKADIRQLAKSWGLSIWDKPSAACLASRVAYGVPLTPEGLVRIDRAEEFLRSLGLKGQLRVRDHGGLARIEAGEEALSILLPHRQAIAAKLKELGFAYVTLDMQGYRMGSQNEVL